MGATAATAALASIAAMAAVMRSTGIPDDGERTTHEQDTSTVLVWDEYGELFGRSLG